MFGDASDEQAYHLLLAYSFAPEHYVVHQYVVDAYAAQTADEQTKPITVVFALAGLYLHFEKGLTGPEVQRAHMRMAKARKDWPRLPLVKERGAMTASDVIRCASSVERDAAIEQWARMVWEAWRPVHPEISRLVAATLQELRSSERD
jgi:hypothetical protein